MTSIGLFWYPIQLIESYKSGPYKHFSCFQTSCQTGLREKKILFWFLKLRTINEGKILLIFCRISHYRTGNFAINKKNPDDNTRGVQFRCWEEITQKKSNINDVFIAHMSRILPWRRNITSHTVQKLRVISNKPPSTFDSCLSIYVIDSYIKSIK